MFPLWAGSKDFVQNSLNTNEICYLKHLCLLSVIMNFVLLYCTYFIYIYIYLTVVFEALAKWYGVMGWVVKNVLEKIMP